MSPGSVCALARHRGQGCVLETQARGTQGCSGWRETPGDPGLCNRAREGRRLPAASGCQPRDVPCPLDCGQSGLLLGEPQGQWGARLRSLPLDGVTAEAGVRSNLCQPSSPAITMAPAWDIELKQETRTCWVNAGPGCYCRLT